MIVDEEDEIAEEIPVFLSKNLQDSLFMVQFPTKNRVGSFSKANVRHSFIKPLNQELKLEVDLDRISSNYDNFRAEQLVSPGDGKNRTKAERINLHSTMLETQAYTSTRLMNAAKKYVIGVYANKQIHLTPIKNILQMRPAFPHFDREDKRTKAEQKKMNMAEQDNEDEPQQVTVKFSRAGASKLKNKEKTDLVDFLKQREEEPWHKTTWYAQNSAIAKLERQKLFSLTHEISSALAMETPKYAKKLLYNQPGCSSIDALLPPRVISKNHLKGISLVEQLKALLKDVKMMTMNEIVFFLQHNMDSKITYDKVLRNLTQVGTLLHGNWVPQSENLYPKETVLNLNGVSSELMARARDYIMYKFSRNSYLYRPDVITNTRLPPKEATEVLSSIARANSDKKWEMLLPPDTNFEQRHPELVSRQEMIWRTIEHQYSDTVVKESSKRVRKRSIRETKNQVSTIYQPEQHPSSQADNSS